MPLKIKDAPEDLKENWTSILQDCARQLTKTLVQYHHGQIAHQEQLSETVITNASQMIIPEHIVNVPDIPERIESAIQDLCETSLISKHLKKRSSTSKTPLQAKKKNTTDNETSSNEQTSSKNEAMPTKAKKGKHPWRPLIVKKKNPKK